MIIKTDIVAKNMPTPQIYKSITNLQILEIEIWEHKNVQNMFQNIAFQSEL